MSALARTLTNMTGPLRIGSLFSGIGGLELGLEMAGLGETVWQVEVDPFRRRVLDRHWPNVERFEDVRTVGAATLSSVDLICGGFPCQDVSSAGKRVGLSGARSSLWFEYLRIVSELRPQWVVVENVASGADKWVDAVRQGLEQQGCACLPVPLAAADVGAPHERRRIFVVATDVDQNRKHAGAIDAEMAVASQSAANANSSELRLEPRWSGRADWFNSRVVADDGQEREAGRHSVRAGRAGSNTSSQIEGRSESTAGSWRSPVPDILRVVHGVPRELVPPRKRIAALGNAVVPQCAEVIGHIIKELMA